MQKKINLLYNHNPILVSIIVPTFNRCKLVKRCIENLLEQTYPHIEIIIVDDGSTDETKNVVGVIVNEYKTKGIFIKYYYKNNEGAAIARNFGLTRAKGKFIIFHDSDDLMDRKRVETQVKGIAKSDGIDATVGSIVNYDTGIYLFRPNAEYSNPLLHYLNGTLSGGTQAWMFSKQSLVEIGGYDKSLLCQQDQDLTFRFLIHRFKFISIPGSVTYFVNHKGDRVSNKFQTIEGIASVISFRQKIVDYLLKNNLSDLMILELKNLFHLRVECFRINSFKQAVIIWKMGRKLLPKSSPFSSKIYTSFITSYLYYILSIFYRPIKVNIHRQSRLP